MSQLFGEFSAACKSLLKLKFYQLSVTSIIFRGNVHGFFPKLREIPDDRLKAVYFAEMSRNFQENPTDVAKIGKCKGR